VTKSPQDEIDALRAEVAYYARHADEVAGECVRLDLTVSGLKHEITRKRKAFSLLSQLQQTIALGHEIASVYARTISAINATLGMDRTVVLTPTRGKDAYGPDLWLGFPAESAERLRCVAITAPDALTRPGGHVLVNRSTPTSPLTRDIQTSFDLPYFVCVPVVVDVDPVALLISGRLREAKPFYPPLDQGDVETFHAIAGLISAAIQFQRSAALQAEIERQEAEREFAAAIQRNLLPSASPELPGYDIAGASLPARSVGGDYYDFAPFGDGSLALCLGDISGKGMPAAILMSNLQAAVRGQLVIDPRPGPCVNSANNLLYRNTDANQFATFFYGLLDAGTGRLSFTNAGHNPPMLFRGRNDPVLLEPCGPILGFQQDLEYDERTITVEHGDQLVIFSDGVTEAMDAHDNEFGVDRLVDVMTGSSGAGAQAAVDAVLAAVRQHSRDVPQSDDITILVVRREAAAD